LEGSDVNGASAAAEYGQSFADRLKTLLKMLFVEERNIFERKRHNASGYSP
jgi:hypothetical protein